MQPVAHHPGDIVLLDFPFTNSQGSKYRPALVLAPGDYPGDYVVAYITSNADLSLSLPHCISFDIDDLQSGQMAQASAVRIDKVITASSKTIGKGPVARLGDSKLREVLKCWTGMSVRTFSRAFHLANRPGDDPLRLAAEAAEPLGGVEAASSELKQSHGVEDESSKLKQQGTPSTSTLNRTSTSTLNFNSPPRPVAAVMVTTDKCYENKEWLNSYREDDAMGGYDPYSGSKGAAEIAIHAMRRSYFGSPQSSVRVASARAGNVIGGGDWALDRIVPDCVRALTKGECIPVRNKTATRPWQHVLEPLSGYLRLAAALAQPSDFPVLQQILDQPGAASAAFNFGPNLSSNRTVADLVQEFIRHWPGEWEDKSDPSAPHEATKLNLATDKAFHTLGWQPRWDFETTIVRTASWYRESINLDAPEGFRELTRQQIHEYSRP